MARVTASFTIEKEQLDLLDELAKELDRDRSSTLRQLISIGIPMLREHNARVARPSLTEMLVGAPLLRAPEVK